MSVLWVLSLGEAIAHRAWHLLVGRTGQRVPTHIECESLTPGW